ncbi:hypothetical protein [Alloyangia mangrovi]|uniref:Uncharacterized protein n=1 Tax=Alloyangia mangrovi TaxID=1779329 RepID=A0A2A3JTQ5_9RHOB|nr:hypothetical protein [Alloyangia mangrovi]
MQMESAPDQVIRLIRRCHRSKAVSVLNLAPAYRLEAKVLSPGDLIVVNEDEAEAMAGWPSCDATAVALANRVNTGVLRTLGGRGPRAAGGVRR